MGTPLRIGIVGAGANTRAKHIPGLQALDNVSIEVVCNRSRESGRRVAAAFGIPRVETEWRNVAADPDIDAVVIGTWPYLHAPATLVALEAGKHVLCEARMAMDATEAEAMVEAARSRPELTAQVVPSPFTLKWDRFLARRLKEGLIGDVLAVDVFANCGAFVDPDRNITWREEREFSGLNTMMLGIYYEAMARWVGHAETVEARGRVFVSERTDEAGTPRPVEIPDHLDVLGELECGASYHIRCSGVTGACPTPNDVLLYGSAGTLRLNVSEDTCTLHKPDGSGESLVPEEDETEGWRVEAEFVGAIRGEEPVRLTPFEEGLRYMRFTQRVMEAAGFA